LTSAAEATNCAGGFNAGLKARTTRTSGYTNLGTTLAPLGAAADIYNKEVVISFETVVFPELIIAERDPGPEATSHGLLADFLTAIRSS
jgi:hypothetical protein